MKRRRFVQLSGSALAVALAGCSDNGGNNTETEQTPEDTRLRIGESAEHKGVEVTVNGYDLVDAYTLYDAREETFEDGRRKEPPTAGGIFLFLDVTVTNVGDKRRTFPGIGRDGITGTYNDQAVKLFRPDRQVKSDAGQEYESYTGLVRGKNAVNGGAYPDVVVDGWLVMEVPRTLIPTNLTLTFDWGPQEEKKAHEWTIDNELPERTPEGYDYEIETGRQAGEDEMDGGNNNSS